MNNQLDSWLEIMQRKEDLLPELQDYLEQGANFPMVRHPLVFSVPHSEQQNAMVNHQYKMKLEAVNDALINGKFGSYIALHERPYRIDAFIEYITSVEVNSKDYWSTLADIYTDSENIYQNFDTWCELLEDVSFPARCQMMDESETYHLIEELPIKMLIFRGYKYSDTSKWLSWSTSYQTARFFADRFVADGHVASAYVDKVDVIAYFNGRNESEVLVKFDDVSDVIMQVGE